MVMKKAARLEKREAYLEDKSNRKKLGLKAPSSARAKGR
jgi:hypothetical protein